MSEDYGFLLLVVLNQGEAVYAYLLLVLHAEEVKLFAVETAIDWNDSCGWVY